MFYHNTTYYIRLHAITHPAHQHLARACQENRLQLPKEWCGLGAQC